MVLLDHCGSRECELRIGRGSRLQIQEGAGEGTERQHDRKAAKRVVRKAG
jgi:hypothetical protein